MKKTMINKLFTEKVSQFINDGWVINYSSMAGHQGELGKVDLMKDNVLARVWLDLEHDYKFEDKYAWHGNKIVLRVSTWKYPAEQAISDWNTVWMKDLNTIEEHIFYQISETYFTQSEAEAINAQTEREDRNRKHWDMHRMEKVILTDDTSKDIARHYLRRVHGYQRVSWDKISITKNTFKGHTTYEVVYNGKGYGILK